MKDLSNDNIIYIKKDGLEYIKFKRLLEYKEIEHCFTLKPLDFASNITYEKKRKEGNIIFMDVNIDRVCSNPCVFNYLYRVYVYCNEK